jgi:NAD(P)H-hydrate epimerase
MSLPVISIALMRDWEKATWASGQTEAEVIRQVGRAVAAQALRMTQPGDRILILAGKGHNGDDSRMAQGHLTDRRVQLLEVINPTQDLAKLEAQLSFKPALIIDGLFGIGINRQLSSDWVAFLDRVNRAQAKVLAVDIPSGLNGDSGTPEGSAIHATVTLTVGVPKVGLLRESAWPFVGRLEVADEVGFVSYTGHSELQWVTKNDFAGFPPLRQVATHKGSYGHLAIIAGSLGFHGASVLTARAAQRAHPGLITLFSQEQIYSAVASQLQAVMVSLWHEEVKFPDSTSAILAGPGLASPDIPAKLKTLVQDLWRESAWPMIVDASALAWLPHGSVRPDTIRVITPHPGEAGRLLNWDTKQVQADRIGALRKLSQTYGNTWVVLKGHQTLIGRSQGEVHVNSSGNPQLAQGGSGDVLSGYLAGILAQPILRSDPLKAISYAVWQHGAAADSLSETRPNWVVEELIERLGLIADQ